MRSFTPFAAGTHAVAIALSVAVVFPLLWMISTAFKRDDEFFTPEIRLIPDHPTLENFVQVWSAEPMLAWFGNSLTTSAGITAGQIFLSILAAYGFARFNFAAKRPLFLLVIGSMIVPFQVTMIPNYILVAEWHLLDTIWAVIIPNMPAAFAVFLLRQHFLVFPKDLFDAAMIDGANSWQVLWRIVVPISRSALAALAILLFLNAWNMYFWPLLVLSDKTAQTLPLGLRHFTDPEAGNAWGLLMAGATLASLPPLLAYAFAQRQIINSFVTSGLKS
jgi:multiple sugar transport system permease protein/sn-glycerol 3-phosphate transport system permease protein